MRHVYIITSALVPELKLSVQFQFVLKHRGKKLRNVFHFEKVSKH